MAEGFTAGAWARFWARSGQRSRDGARARPRAALHTHLLHGALLGATRDQRVLLSWAMAWAHLGLLPDHAGLGVANTITLLRANLPLIAPARPRTVAVAALISDLVDGTVARRTRSETAFGAYADALADAVFWGWFVRRYEPNSVLRRAALAFWGAPVAAIAAVAFVRGSMPVAPRPTFVRSASAVLQCALLARAVIRGGR